MEQSFGSISQRTRQKRYWDYKRCLKQKRIKTKQGKESCCLATARMYCFGTAFPCGRFAKKQEKRCSSFGRPQIKSPSFCSPFFERVDFFKGQKKSCKTLRVLHCITQLVTFIAFLGQSSRQATLSAFVASLRSFVPHSLRSATTRPPPAIILLACGSQRASGKLIN